MPIHSEKSPQTQIHQLKKLYLIISVILVTGFLGYAINTWVNIGKQVEEELNHINQLFVSSLESTFNHHESMLRIMGLRLLDIGALDEPERGRKLINDLINVNPSFAGFGLAEPSGQLLLVSGVPKGKPLPNLLENVESSSTFLQVYDTDGMVIGRTYFMPLLKKWLIPIRMAIRDQADHIALVNTAGVNIQSTHAIWNAIELHPGMHINLLRDDGFIQLSLPTGESIQSETYDDIYSFDDFSIAHTPLSPDPTRENSIAMSMNTVDGSMRSYASYPESHLRNQFLKTIAAPSLVFSMVFLTILFLFYRTIKNHQLHEQQLIKMAQYDSLTHLPNRLLTLDRLGQQIEEAKRADRKVAVLFIDLDNFKKVNDSLGHETGDLLLVKAAERLKNLVRAEDTVGRLGGDEFVILLGHIADTEDVRHTARKIVSAFRKPHLIQQRELVLTASMGISMYPDNGDMPSELLSNSDAAMYYSKGHGRDTFQFFTDSMNQAVTRKLDIEEELRSAIQRSELHLVYQPIVNLESNRVEGFEALLRWTNAKLGFVPPDEFISIAEKSGLIIEIGNFVIEQSVQALSHMHQSHSSALWISINLSPKQLRDSQFIPYLDEVVNNARCNPEHIKLEITEGLLLDAYSQANEVLSKIIKRGYPLVMDDFGTGYSSLNYLHNYPFSQIKIDRSFVESIDTNPKSRELVATSILMAHNMDKRVIAEGVETDRQLKVLQELGCDHYQGYLFSKPTRFDNALALLQTQFDSDNKEPKLV